MAVKTAKAYQHYKGVPELAGDPGQKKKRPQLMAVVDEDSCTGCKVCIPFCPVDCIEPVSNQKYENTPIPPVQVRFNECIGCNACFKACRQLTWDAIRMIPTDEFEQMYNITID